MRVAVVGVCGSGKTTIVGRLRALGLDAFAVGQEHSIIPALWNHTGPDHVVVLDISLEGLRARRGANWPDSIFALQQERLADARAHAAVIVRTDLYTEDDTVRQILAALEKADEGDASITE